VRAILADMAAEAGDDDITLPLRVFRRDRRAVLVDVLPSADIDDRRWGKRGITEVPTR